MAANAHSTPTTEAHILMGKCLRLMAEDIIDAARSLPDEIMARHMQLAATILDQPTNRA